MVGEMSEINPYVLCMYEAFKLMGCFELIPKILGRDDSLESVLNKQFVGREYDIALL